MFHLAGRLVIKEKRKIAAGRSPLTVVIKPFRRNRVGGLDWINSNAASAYLCSFLFEAMRCSEQGTLERNKRRKEDCGGPGRRFDSLQSLRLLDWNLLEKREKQKIKSRKVFPSLLWGAHTLSLFCCWMDGRTAEMDVSCEEVVDLPSTNFFLVLHRKKRKILPQLDKTVDSWFEYLRWKNHLNT